ncbi:MAG: hypothetical protein AB7J13_02370 [Pyrinomonadaceae bacterium]
MHKAYGIIGIFILTLCFGLSANAQGRFGFGYVKNPDGNESVWLAGVAKRNRTRDKAILSHGHTFAPRININGKDISLKSVKSDLPDANFKVGRGGYEIFEGKGVRVRLDYVFTWLCPSDQENCSVFYYRGVLDVTYKGAKRKVNVTGFGGS